MLEEYVNKTRGRIQKNSKGWGKKQKNKLYVRNENWALTKNWE